MVHDKTQTKFGKKNERSKPHNIHTARGVITLMKNTLRIFVYTIVAASLALSGCKSKKAEWQEVVSEKATTPVVITRLDSLIYAYPSMNGQDKAHMMQANADGLNALAAISGNRVVSDSLISAISGSKAMEIFYGRDGRLLPAPAMTQAEASLGRFAAIMTTVIPGFRMPALYGVVIPYNQGIVRVDSVMLIGLNHYLGSGYEGYSNFPQWQRSRKSPDRLAVDIAYAILQTQLPAPDATEAGGAPTALSRMLRDGALVYAITQILPDCNAASVLAYTSQDSEWLEKNEKMIWQTMIERDLLYSTDPAIAQRLTAPGPSTSVIHPSAPGATGTYIGYKIVESYSANHPEATLAEILSERFYSNPTATLSAASYTP